jgi:hypothetical protein
MSVAGVPEGSIHRTVSSATTARNAAGASRARTSTGPCTTNSPPSARICAQSVGSSAGSASSRSQAIAAPAAGGAAASGCSAFLSFHALGIGAQAAHDVGVRRQVADHQEPPRRERARVRGLDRGRELHDEQAAIGRRRERRRHARETGERIDGAEHGVQAGIGGGLRERSAGERHEGRESGDARQRHEVNVRWDR